MHILRRSSLLLRLVLAWFVLTVGIAAASPLVQPQSMELICSANGTMMVVVTDDDGGAGMRHALDCPICMTVPLPATAPSVSFDQPDPMAHALEKLSVAHMASLIGAPLPPRGPPHSV